MYLVKCYFYLLCIERMESVQEFPLSVEDMKNMMDEAPFPSLVTTNEDPFMDDEGDVYPEKEVPLFSDEDHLLLNEIEEGTKRVFHAYFRERIKVCDCDRCYVPLNDENRRCGFESYESHDIVYALGFNVEVLEAIRLHSGFMRAFLENEAFRDYVYSVVHELYFQPVLCSRCNGVRNLATTKENYETLMRNECDKEIFN